MSQFQKRNAAYKVRILDIINRSYLKNDNGLNYLDSGGNNIYRVNVIGTIVIKNTDLSQFGSVIIDDGTGRLLLRSFDNLHLFDSINIGDLLLVIGKPREYGNERYVIPEIIKRIDDKRWVVIRELELDAIKSPEKPEKEFIADNLEKPAPKQMIFRLVQELDKGNGVDIEELIGKSNLDNANGIVEEMLREGSIYEISAGRVRLV